MRSVLFAAAAGTLATSSVAAPASDYSIKDTRRLAYDYSKCVVGRKPKEASEAILANADNKTILTRYSALIDGNCLVRSTHANSKMSFTGDLYRYALADALVARELASLPVPDVANIPALQRKEVPAAPAPLAMNASKADRLRYDEAVKQVNEAKAFRLLDAFGECVVRSNPVGAKTLLLTVPETAAEMAGFNALRLTFAQCLPEGNTIEFGKLPLRGTIALNYYRLAHAAGLHRPS